MKRMPVARPQYSGAKLKVIGTIDIESERRNAFTREVQALLERCADVIAALWRSGISAG